MADYHLDGRVALVTGGSSGIGRGICDRLAASGANIVVADIRREPRQSAYFELDDDAPTDELVAENHDVESTFIETDTADPENAEATIDQVTSSFDRLDILVNNAGIIVPGDSQEVDVADYVRAIDVNLNGYFYMTKFAVPALRDSSAGRLITISSVNAHYGGGGAAYAASKAGVVNMTRDFAVELADAGVTANAILPGPVKTSLQDVGGEDAIDRRCRETPLPRLGEATDIGNVAAFLASDEAEWVTGAEIVVDGGYVAGGH